MSFGDLDLDTRSFQDLVDEARRNIIQLCPEWTDHNVSDPGITLIEAFALMTEQLIYRLNRVPVKLHLALLNLLGVQLAPPSPAEAELRFRVAEATDTEVRIPARLTEVVTADTSEDDPLVFRVIDDFVIPPLRPTAVVFLRGDGLTSIPVRSGVAHPTGMDEAAFSVPPKIDDAIYLGFDAPLARLVIRVDVTGERAQGVGVVPSAPPLRWEASDGARWVDVEVLSDTTGGFNMPGGAIELQLPDRTAAGSVAEENLHWLRCRVARFSPHGAPSPRYTQPPRLDSITARPVGARVRAEHANTVEQEMLPESDGTTNQTFYVRRRPAMALRDGETLEVCEPGKDEWEAWDEVESFELGKKPQFRFDPAVGQVTLGPSIRTRDRGWKEHGAVPPKGARLRMSRYRYGGGERGGVAAGALSQLRNPIPGVTSVTNPEAATGGGDAETVEVGRRRAAAEFQTRYRAVTREDFEFLAGEVADGAVARACCVVPKEGEAVRVHVLPKVKEPRGMLRYEQLLPSEELLEKVEEYLDRRRLVGTSVHVMPVPLRAVTAVVQVTTERRASAREVEQLIKEALETFINPIVGGSVGPDASGWGFGQTLNEGELFSLVQDVPGVDRVVKVRMYETDPETPDKPSPTPAVGRIEIAANELLCSAHHHVLAGRRNLGT